MTPSVARGRRAVVIDACTAANFVAIGDLRHDITELSTQRKRFELAHELAHQVLAQEETNQTGMSALFQAIGLLQQVAPPSAVDRPTSFPGTVTAPAVDLTELTHALADFNMPASRTGTPSTASMLAPVDSAHTAAALVSPAPRITLKAASPDATFLRFIARLIADLSIAMVRLTDSMLSAIRVRLARLLAALGRRLDRLAFGLVILAACRRYGRRSEPDDHVVLPMRRYQTSWGAIACA